MSNPHLQQSPLGKENTYVSQYQPDLLFPIARNDTRKELGINLEQLPFQGEDIWTAFEISWLNTKGKPLVAIGEFIIPCESPRLVESKSFKLYLNSLNNTKFASIADVEKTLISDLSAACGAPIRLNLVLLGAADLPHGKFTGTCIDDLDVDCTAYTITPNTLTVTAEIITETLYSDLLKSNCPVTGQPDWASVEISYTGRKIDRAGLLQYLVSFRDHNGFHEDCVERIFTDISKQCQPQKLFVYARYTRRGGLDINPYRANYAIKRTNARLNRQ